MSPTRQEIAADVNRIEGYLLLQAERSSARRDAEDFARLMPWLTSGQRDEFIRLYTEERRRLTRQTLQRISDRAIELRGEYSARYQRLRLATWCTAAAVVSVVGLLGFMLALL